MTRRAPYRNAGVVPLLETDPALVALCVPLWVECAKRANSRHGGTKPGNVNGLAPILDSPDAMLAAHGVLFLRDPELWAAYEAAVRVAARAQVTRRNGRSPRKPGSTTPLSDAERAEILRRLGDGEAPKDVAKAVGRSVPIVYQLRKGAA